MRGAAGYGIDVIDSHRLALVANIKTGPAPASVAVEFESGDVWVGDGVEGTMTRISAVTSDQVRHWS
jgi:hypothetical protein